MTRRFVYLRLLGLAALLAPTHFVAGQEMPVTSTANTSEATTPLRRLVSLHIERVPLAQALTILSNDAGVRIVYGPKQIPADKLVSVSGDAMTVSDALAVMLDGTGISVSLSPSGWILLAPPHPRAASVLPQAQGSATITGLVTDSGTGAIITQAVVHVDGTQLTVRTNATGHYTFSGVAAGEYRVTARHVGYLAKTRVVTLTDSGAKAVDFLLNQPATTLNDVVTTAIGDERRYQVGNVISTINVDSIAPNAPVTSVTDLITGRAPGVDVVEQSGMVGSGEDIRIRGISSLLLQSDPIIIVDGIRVDDTPGGTSYFNPCCLNGVIGPSPYRLNDLDVNQIETVEILKGPAATTEYGTDGANGVIIITTKRGSSGRPQWSASASQTASTVPLSYPPIVWNWGHTADGRAQPFTASNGDGESCVIQYVAPGRVYNPTSYYFNIYKTDQKWANLERGSCIVDSTTSFSPFDHAATTEYGTGPASDYNLGVGGGSETMRYYFAAGSQDQTGVLKVPDVFRSQALALGFSNSLLRPNTQNQSSLLANATIKASSTVNVQVGVAYTNTYADFPQQSNLHFGGTAATNSMATYYGYQAPYDTGVVNTPLALQLGTNMSQGTEGWTGSSTVDWRPASWLAGHVTAGLQHEAQTEQFEYLPQAALLGSNYQDTSGGGSLSQQQGRNDFYNVAMSGSATATLWHKIGFITTVGAAYYDERSSYVAGNASGLSASAFSLNGASNISLGAAIQAVKNGGAYVEENLSFSDRCYAPIGLRFDVASGYGANVSGTQNPNYSLTCTVLTGKTSLRLRGAYGVSDQQPPYGANVGVYTTAPGQAVNDPGSTTVYYFNNPGNQEVKPERDQALEGGFDLGLWHERLQFEFTAYNQRQHDLLLTQTLGWDLQGNYYENVGNHRNEGMELTVTANLLQSRPLSVGITVNGSVNHDKLLSLAPDLLTTKISGTQQFVVGYPLYGYWGDTLSYRDANHDGILEGSEVYFSSQQKDGVGVDYAGTASPVEMLSIAPTAGLWRGAIQLNAMLDYGGDYKVLNGDQLENDAYGVDPYLNQLDAPLWAQAYGDAESFSNSLQDIPADMYFNGTYLALNELSVALNTPSRVARSAHLRTLSLVLAVRNVAVWTTYPLGDPRVGNNGQSVNGNVNNDIRLTSLSVVPLTRQWTIRLNAGL